MRYVYLANPRKAVTLYDQFDYETFTRINKLDMYSLEYDKPRGSVTSQPYKKYTVK
jgi:hypothetical protein